MKFTVVIPAKNEQDSMAKILKTFSRLKLKKNVLIVDSSSDRTAEIAKMMGINVIKEDRQGYGRAYITGFKRAKGDIIVTCDADGSYPVHLIPHLIKRFLKEKADFVSCSRVSKNNGFSIGRKIGNHFLTAMTNLLFSLNLKDSQSGMWIFKRKLLDQLSLKQNGMAFSTEIKLEAIKYGKFIEVDIPYVPRIGKSKTTFSDGIKIFLFLLRRRFDA